MPFNKQQILLIAFILLLFSCKENTPDIKQGIIEYDIEYVENNMPNMATNLLPKKMVLSFNEQYSKTSIDGFMGMFNISLISDFEKGIDITMVRFLDKKYVHFSEPNEYSSIFNKMPELVVNTTDSIATICGFESRYARVINSTLKDTSFDVFYTTALGNGNPNFHNPYYKLKGVLLQFHLQLGNIKMQLVADKVIEKDIDDSHFEVPEDFVQTTKDNMDLIIKSLLEN